MAARRADEREKKNTLALTTYAKDIWMEIRRCEKMRTYF